MNQKQERDIGIIKTLLSSMFDSVSKYSFHLHKDEKKSLELALLLDMLEKYVNGAIIEMSRMESTRSAINKRLIHLGQGLSLHRSRSSSQIQLTRLGCDTHFFFICIDKCYKLINQLALELQDSSIELLAKKLGTSFDIETIRNHLEHIDQRCVGYLTLSDQKNKVKKPIQDFGNFIGDHFSFNGKKFPSNRKSLDDLKDIYRDLINILHTNYASKDPTFLQKEEAQKRLDLIMKALKKAGVIQ